MSFFGNTLIPAIDGMVAEKWIDGYGRKARRDLSDEEVMHIRNMVFDNLENALWETMDDDAPTYPKRVAGILKSASLYGTEIGIDINVVERFLAAQLPCYGKSYGVDVDDGRDFFSDQEFDEVMEWLGLSELLKERGC